MRVPNETRKRVANIICKFSPAGEQQAFEAHLEPLLEEIRRKHGGALLAILVYGSWLRGKRDTMLDFYVLVDNYRTLTPAWQGWLCRLLPPNVYQIHCQADTPGAGGDLRAKYALLTLERFRHAMEHDFHSYFWARFAQPCVVLYARDQAVRDILSDAFSMATTSFVRRVLPAMPEQFDCRELWTGGLALTYQCELRTEGSGRADTLYNFNPAYYEAVTEALAADGALLTKSANGTGFINQGSRIGRKSSRVTWWLRRLQGKALSLLRLLKAALTFNQPLEYLLWKIERHTGLYIEPSPRQLKYPLVFAWPLLWRLYRDGAFR